MLNQSPGKEICVPSQLHHSVCRTIKLCVADEKKKDTGTN